MIEGAGTPQTDLVWGLPGIIRWKQQFKLDLPVGEGQHFL